MSNIQQQNKDIVTRFNKEFVVGGNMDAFNELIADGCINHVAPPGTINGKESMRYFLSEILRPAFPDIQVEIFDQVAEGDKVVSRKTFYATHLGNFMGVAPTGKKVEINVIDIIRLKDGKYVDHWGMSNIESVVAALSAS